MEKLMSITDKLVVGSDHAGFEMKEYVKKYLQKKGIQFDDAGAESLDPSDDYPTYAFKLAKSISSGKYRRGILFCGTGIGASIAANRVKGVRAALCTSPELAKMARLHNDSNVLVLGGRTTPKDTAEKIIDTWLATEFEGGRHLKRVKMLDKLPMNSNKKEIKNESNIPVTGKVKQKTTSEYGCNSKSTFKTKTSSLVGTKYPYGPKK